MKMFPLLGTGEGGILTLLPFENLALTLHLMALSVFGFGVSSSLY